MKFPNMHHATIPGFETDKFNAQVPTNVIPDLLDHSDGIVFSIHDARMLCIVFGDTQKFSSEDQQAQAVTLCHNADS